MLYREDVVAPPRPRTRLRNRPAHRSTGRRPRRRVVILVGVLVAMVGAIAVHVLQLGVHPPGKRTFHVSPRGDDNADGLSPDSAWQSLARADATLFLPGDKLLLEGGATYRGNLSIGPGEAGNAEAPVLVGSYGTGRARIEAVGASAISVYNTAGVEIRDLKIVGDPSAYGNKGGINVYSDLRDDRKLAHIVIAGVDATGFKGGIEVGAANNGTGFRDVRVTDCVLHGNQEVGFLSYGPGFDAASPAYAHEAVTVSRVEVHNNVGDPTNHISNTGSGIVLGSVRGGRVEHSSAHDNGAAVSAPEGPVGIWAYDSTSVVIERNVSYRNRTAGLRDGGGFDLDQNVSNSVIQYNLSYDNDGAGYMLYSGRPNAAHTGNTVRFNISSNDARKLAEYGSILLAGAVYDAHIYHNTIVISRGSQAPAVGLRYGLSNVTLRNNVFVTAGTDLVRSTSPMRPEQILFQGNNFFPTAGPWSVFWGPKRYATLGAWRTATGQERLGSTDTGLGLDPGFAGGTLPVVTGPEPTGFAPRLPSTMTGRALDLRELFGIDPGPVDLLGRPLAGPPVLGAVQPMAQ